VAACSPRRPVGPLSSRQRSWDFPLRSLLLPGGGTGFPRPPHPPAVKPQLAPARRTAPAGVTTTGFRALALPRSPMTSDRCLAHRQLDAPLGFSPSRVLLPTAWPGARTPRSPCVLRRDPAKAGHRPAPEGLDQRSTHPTQAPSASQRRPSPATLLGFACLSDPAGSKRPTVLAYGFAPRATGRYRPAPTSRLGPSRPCRSPTGST